MKLPPTTRLEWEVNDESNAFVTTRPPGRDTFHHHASKMRRRWCLIVFVGTLLLVASVIGVVRLAAKAERNIAQTEREIELAVEADSWLRYPAALKPHIQSIELHNDLAIVQMSVDDGVVPGERLVADWAAYYRYSTQGWKRVEPNGANRGPYRYKETAHLLFQYDEVDKSLMEAVVPAIETFTTGLHRDLGLDLSPAHKKVTVRIAIVAARQPVDPADRFDLVGYVTWESNGTLVLSPRLERVPATLASSNTLTQAIDATVAYRTILLAVEEYQPQAVWRPLVDGLQLWAYSAHREFDSDLAKNMNNLLRQQLANQVPLRLPVLSIVPPPLSGMEETPDIRWQQSVLAKIVIDYMIATYGRSSLARLLDGMHHYDSWESLIPAMFSVSTEEFRSGWQAYLTAQNDLYP